MKIAQVVSTFSPHFGGMGMVCEEESDGLVDRGFDVTVFTMRYPKFVYSVDLFMFKIKRLRPWIKLGDAGFLPQLVFHLRSFDLIHLHYPFYGGAEWVWFSKILFKKKYIVTFHMLASPSGRAKKWIQRIYDNFWQKKILSGAEKILVVDKKYWSDLPVSKEIPENKVVELHNGVNLKIFRPGLVDSKELDLENWREKKIILFVGNLLNIKRLDLLFDSLNDLRRDDWRLLIVGGGYAEEEYKNKVKILGIEEKVKFTGYCFDRDRLVEYYRASWVTVLPTDNESFSLVAIESLACGTPVIVAAGSGGENRIKPGENGWTFKPGSKEDLKRALSESLGLTFETKNEWGKRGRGYVVDYDWNKHLDELRDIYGKI